MNIVESKRFKREGDLGSYLPKGDDTRSPLKIWDRRSWIYQGIQVDSAPQLLREIMLIRWRSNLTCGLFKLLNKDSPI